MRKKISVISLILVLFMILSVIISLFAIRNIKYDIRKMSADVDLMIVDHTLEMYSEEVMSFYRERMVSLESVAECIEKMDLSDKISIQRLLGGKTNLFDETAIIDDKGGYVCGDKINTGELINDPEFANVLKGDSKVSSGTYVDNRGEEVIYIMSPIAGDGAKRIVVGSVLIDTIESKLDASGMIDDMSCLFMLDKDYKYIFGSKDYKKKLGESDEDFDGYISDMNFTKGDYTKLKNLTDPNDAVMVKFNDGKKFYFSGYVLMPINDMIMVYVKDVTGGGTTEKMSDTTGLLVSMSFILQILIVFIALVILIEFMRLKWKNRRYEILESCDGSTSFEYRFNPKKIIFYGDLKNFIGIDLKPLVGDSIYEVYDWIHPDDLSSVRSSFRNYFEGDEGSFSVEVRVRNVKGEYNWCRIVGRVVRNKVTGVNELFVGKIINAEEQITEEKDLMQRAENDLLTGVLNKKTMEKRISLMLKERKSNYVIFFMVDLDNFKNVNDKLGHMYGDQAIVETAQCLNKVFSNQDSIGRLGGDEFAVCVSYQAFDEQALRQFINKKAEEICRVNRRRYTDGVSEVMISSSVGISYAPKMGDTFEELYEKADRALYCSKENGKNTYHVYTKEK